MLSATSLPALAADDAALADLVNRQSEMLAAQARQLETLQARLAQLESREQPSQPSTVTSVSPTVVDEGQQNSTHKLRNRVALLEASQAGQSRIDWSDGGPKFISADGTRTFEIGGRLQFDGSTTTGSRFDDESTGRNISGTQARRLQLKFAGQLSERVGYKLQYDLAGNDVGMRDAYLSSQFELGKHDAVVYVGNKYDDRTLDGATSSNNTWFMERSFVNEAVAPDRGSYGLGVKGKVYGDSRTWHASLAVTNGRLGEDTDHSATTTYMSRAHWNPWTSGKDMVHLGVWGFYEDFDRSDDAVFKNINAADDFNDNVTIRSRKLDDPESSTAYGYEVATSIGAFAAAAEYGRRHVVQRGDSDGKDMSYDAYSVQVGYFLTGEQHGYSRKSGVWRLPEVKSPISAGGWGAFQLAARYQALDFDDGPDYPGGDGHATTLGLNWYPNDWSRVMLNYILWDTHNRSGDFKGPDDGSTLATRLQVVF